jgi:ABC-type uncharacterized transport system ATPase component
MIRFLLLFTLAFLTGCVDPDSGKIVGKHIEEGNTVVNSYQTTVNYDTHVLVLEENTLVWKCRVSKQIYDSVEKGQRFYCTGDMR